MLYLFFTSSKLAYFLLFLFFYMFFFIFFVYIFTFIIKLYDFYTCERVEINKIFILSMYTNFIIKKLINKNK